MLADTAYNHRELTEKYIRSFLLFKESLMKKYMMVQMSYIGQQQQVKEHGILLQLLGVIRVGFQLILLHVLTQITQLSQEAETLLLQATNTYMALYLIHHGQQVQMI